MIGGLSTNQNFNKMYDANELLMDEEITTPLKLDVKELSKPIIKFFKKHSAYDIMPSSTKVIVFDIDAKVKEAFSVAAETSTTRFSHS
jgi:hypothetical protein